MFIHIFWLVLHQFAIIFHLRPHKHCECDNGVQNKILIDFSYIYFFKRATASRFVLLFTRKTVVILQIFRNGDSFTATLGLIR